MDQSRAVRILKDHEAELRSRGVRHAALFGSVARGVAGPGSDIDVMVDLDPTARISVYDYVGIVEYVQSLFGEPVDVSNRETLKPPRSTFGRTRCHPHILGKSTARCLRYARTSSCSRLCQGPGSRRLRG